MIVLQLISLLHLHFSFDMGYGVRICIEISIPNIIFFDRFLAYYFNYKNVLTLRLKIYNIVSVIVG